MSSATDDPELETVVRFWGHAYTFEYDPAGHPEKPYAAHPRQGGDALRAATSALLLDAVKDDQSHAGTSS